MDTKNFTNIFECPIKTGIDAKRMKVFAPNTGNFSMLMLFIAAVKSDSGV